MAFHQIGCVRKQQISAHTEISCFCELMRLIYSSKKIVNPTQELAQIDSRRILSYDWGDGFAFINKKTYNHP